MPAKDGVASGGDNIFKKLAFGGGQAAAKLSLTSPEVLELVRSEGFYQKFRSEIGRRVLFEIQEHDPIKVEYEIDEERLGKILQHVESVWTKLGEDEPHWSVVSTADFKSDRIAETINKFRDTGRAEAENLKRILKRVGLTLKPAARGLEFGCGVGRVTRWLAPMCGEMTGVDVSSNHLKLAEEYFRNEGVSNVQTAKVSSLENIEELPAFDFLYSKIVLQHNPPPMIARILEILCNKLNGGGIGVVQIPTYCRNYVFDVDSYLAEMQKIDKMEMHVLPQQVIFEILDRQCCVPQEVSRDHLVSTVDFVSTTFVFTKR